jgi:acetyltransferase-like isoleucine patch superfamily enzyme
MREVGRYPDGPSWLVRSPWSLRWELNRWAKHVLGGIPGRLGSFLRRKAYPFASCGKDDLLMERLWVEYPERLHIGDHVNVNRDCFINAGGGVTIGDWVLIGPKVVIYSQNHVFDGIDVPMSLGPDRREPVRIGHDVWVGAHASIMPGVTIGDGAVVAAGAVVTRDVAARSIVAGVPARHIRFRDEAPVRREGVAR